MIFNKIKRILEIKRESNLIILIHDQENEEKVNSFFFVLIIIFAWVFEEQAIEKYNYILSRLEFWFFELIIIAYLNKVILHIDIYKHQKCVIFFSFFPIIFKIMTILVELNDGDNRFIYEEEGHIYWIPLGLLIYFPLITLKAYAIIKIKWFMDLKYISANKLLMIYGFIGTIFYSIFCTLSSFIKNDKYSLFINSSYDYYSYYCIFKESNKTQIIIEIIVLISSMITSYIIKYNFMMIIKYLTPLHIVFLTPIFYFFSKVIILIYNVAYSLINNRDFSNFFTGSLIPYCRLQFALDFSGDFFSFFGFLIYLEMIELNCFGLNYNLRNTIIKRASHEFMEIDDYKRSTIESINDDLNSINSEESKESIINMSNNSNFSY